MDTGNTMSLDRQQLADDIKGLILRLPWWVGLLCALASYLALHPLAIMRTPTPVGMLDTALNAVGQLALGLASAAQYAIPLLFLALAAVSAFLNWKRRDLRASLTSIPGGSGFRGLARDDMNLLVTAAYRALGFQVRETGPKLHRDGFDLELRRGAERRLLQLRNFKVSGLDTAPLRALYRAFQATDADSAAVLISGRFTPEAESFAEGKPVELIDGQGLRELILAPESGGFSALTASLARRLRRADGTAAPSTDARDLQRWRHSSRQAHPDDGERAIGAALGTMIRAQTGLAEPIPESLGAMHRRPESTLRSLAEAAQLALRRNLSAPIRIGRIVNAVGVFVALGLTWVTYAWFRALPATPADTPWDLLGRGAGATASARALPSDGSRGVAESLPPLGQFNYGPDFPLGQPDGMIAGAAAAEPDAPEVFHSIRELEDAFNARYVPPASCYGGGSSGSLADCGNHRIRARRAFMASNGRTMVPPPPVDRRPVSYQHEQGWSFSEEAPIPRWETEPYWGQWPQPSADVAEPANLSEGEPRFSGEWLPPDSGTGQVPDRYGAWWPPQETQPWAVETDSQPRPSSDSAGAETGGWHTEQDGYARSDWGRPDWQPRLEPLAETPYRADYPPRVRRQRVEDWLPRNRTSLNTWRDEQLLRERGYWDDGNTWRQEAQRPDQGAAHGDPSATGGESPDWRREWLQR